MTPRSSISASIPPPIPSPESRVWGELYRMTDVAAVLAALDDIEGYRPDGSGSQSLYPRPIERTLLPDGFPHAGVGVFLQRTARAGAAHCLGRLPAARQGAVKGRPYTGPISQYDHRRRGQAGPGACSLGRPGDRRGHGVTAGDDPSTSVTAARRSRHHSRCSSIRCTISGWRSDRARSSSRARIAHCHVDQLTESSAIFRTRRRVHRTVRPRS